MLGFTNKREHVTEAMHCVRKCGPREGMGRWCVDEKTASNWSASPGRRLVRKHKLLELPKADFPTRGLPGW